MHRDTILKPAAALAGLALLALTIPAGNLAPPALAQASPPGQTRPQAQPQPQGTPPAGQGQRPASQAVGTAGGRGAAQVGRNRRPSYAACNRVSHARGLRGGARRRFLVRCKLGYDRPRAGQPSPAPARAPQTGPAPQP